MPTLAACRLRLQLDALRFHGGAFDVLRLRGPAFWRGNALRFEFAVFGGDSLIDVSNLASLTVEVRALGAGGAAPDPAATPLMGATVSSFDNTTTAINWKAGTNQQAVIEFTPEESNIAAGEQWLSIYGVTNDDPGKVITFYAGKVEVLEDGSGLPTTPAPAGQTFYTAAQSDARFALIGSGGGGGGSWGSITGDITAQTDLVNGFVQKGSIDGAGLTGLGGTLVGVPAGPDGDLVHINLGYGLNLDGAGNLTASNIGAYANGLLPLAPANVTYYTPAFTSYAKGDLLIASNANVFAKLGIGTTGQVLTVVSGVPAWADATGGSGMTNPMTASGDIIYGGASGVPTRLAKGTNGQILTLVSGVPAWQTSVTFNNDGSGHYYVGGSGPATLDGGVTPLLTINGGFAVVNTQGATFVTCMVDAKATGSPTLTVQQNGGAAATGPTAISFCSNPHDTWGTGDASYGTVFMSAGDEGGGWGAGAMVLTGSPAWARSAPTVLPTTGVGQVSLSQEWVFADDAATQLGAAGIGTTGLYQFRPIWCTTKNFSCFVGDPFYQTLGDAAGRTLELAAAPNSGYAEFKIRGTQGYRANNANKAGAIISLWDEDGKFFGVNFLSSTDIYGSSTAMYRKAAANLQTNATDGMSINVISAADMRLATNATERLKIDSAGNFVCSNVVTSDLSATLANSQYQFTVYDNAGTAVFKIRYKDASGTVKTGTLALS